MLEILFEFDASFMIEEMKPSMHVSEGNDAIDGDHQLSGSFWRRIAALRRQQARDHLNAVQKAVFELFRLRAVKAG